MSDSEVRLVDRAHAAQLIAGQMTGDREMFAVAVQAMFDDDYGLGGMGATINVLWSLSEDLVAAILERHGDDAADLVLQVLVQQLAEVQS